MVPLKRKWIGCLCLIIAASSSPLAGQDDTRQQFEKSLAEWKSVYLEIVQVYNEFRICEADQAESLRERFTTLKITGDEAAARTIDLAADILENADRVEPRLLNLLKPLPERYYLGSRYEKSAKIGKAILKHFPFEREMMFNTVRSSYFSNDFAASREIFNRWIGMDGELPHEIQPMFDFLEPLAEAWDREQELRAEEALTDKLPRIKFETTQGDIVVELFENEAPIVVNNLMALVERRNLEQGGRGFFDNLTFFDVLPHQYATTGCQAGNGTQALPVGLATEKNRTVARTHFRGAFSLDVNEADNAVITGCRFIRIPMPELKPVSLVVGRVIEGMDVVDRITATHKLNETLVPERITEATPDRVLQVTVVRKPEGKVYKPIQPNQN